MELTTHQREYLYENLVGHMEDTETHPIVIETTLSKIKGLEDKDLLSLWDETLSNDQKTWFSDEFEIYDLEEFFKLFGLK
jgi:hypothetical protein